MLSDWEIKARSHRCSRTQEKFQDGETIYTLLFRDGAGFRREDVRHILVTHLDFDHAGGLPDFPDAVVHVQRDVDVQQGGVDVQEGGREQRHECCAGAPHPPILAHRPVRTGTAVGRVPPARPDSDPAR